MLSLQFIIYNLTYLAVIAHFLDSAKEQEWTDALYGNNFMLWFISSVVILGIPLIGIVPVYMQSTFGNIWSIVVGIGGLSGYGYHKPMHMLKKSKVCLNKTSYVLMHILTILSVALLLITIYHFYK